MSSHSFVINHVEEATQKSRKLTFFSEMNISYSSKLNGTVNMETSDDDSLEK